ncbi:TonB-dependent receptor [Bacterioplanes sanyensis]|uniref:TonB-dependent receptor n=1 Tax=Bacterioplanes sanyensis TaxID=1249553 RepID=UPI001674AFCA|nr:TonB-dependent receptor [Bacterioplanes sanyensis]GGY49936.1 TonB-dependent receptor [Bacterioplanes sanyensis]
MNRFPPQALAAAIACASLNIYVDNTYADTTQLDKVTVVGEKSQRSLRNTSTSVSVIGAEELQTLEHLSVSAAISETPNLVMLSGSQPNIRGVSGNGSATGFNSFSGGSKARVSRLVDGVAEPFVADLTGDTGLWDVEQIEVYRGPQSTTHGQNSLAGSIYVKTFDPQFDWQAKARVGARNQDQLIDTSAMINAPLVDDQLALRIAAQRLDGDTFNEGLEHDSNPAPFDLNELQSQRIRSKLLWQPNGDVSALLSYVTAEEKGDSGREFFDGKDPWDFIPVTQRYMDTESDVASLTVKYQFNAAVRAEMLLSNTDFHWAFDSYEADPAQQSQVQMQEDDQSLDARLHIEPVSSAASGFIGLNHHQREQDFNSQGASIYAGDDSSSATALYGELHYQLQPSLRLILGHRIQQESQQRDFTMQSRGEAIDATLDRDKTIQLPKLELHYDLSQHHTVAVSARRGYNQGGGALDFNSGDYYYYDSESVNAYELSSRVSFSEGRISVRSNLFFNDYQDYQASNSERRISNIDAAQSYGLETELQANLSADLQLRGALGLLKTRIEDSSDGFADVDGNDLNSAPEVTASAGGRYWLTSAVDIDVSANYVAEYYGDYQNSRASQAGDYWLAHLRINYETAHWLFSGFVNNLNDEQAKTVSSGPSRYSANGYAAVVAPRTIGLSATYTF